MGWRFGLQCSSVQRCDSGDVIDSWGLWHHWSVGASINGYIMWWQYWGVEIVRGDSPGGMPLRTVSCSPSFSLSFYFPASMSRQPSFSIPSTLMLCLDTGPEAMELAHHELEPLKAGAKIKLPSFKLFFVDILSWWQKADYQNDHLKSQKEKHSRKLTVILDLKYSWAGDILQWQSTGVKVQSQHHEK